MPFKDVKNNSCDKRNGTVIAEVSINLPYE